MENFLGATSLVDFIPLVGFFVLMIDVSVIYVTFYKKLEKEYFARGQTVPRSGGITRNDPWGVFKPNPADSEDLVEMKKNILRNLNRWVFCSILLGMLIVLASIIIVSVNR